MESNAGVQLGDLREVEVEEVGSVGVDMMTALSKGREIVNEDHGMGCWGYWRGK